MSRRKKYLCFVSALGLLILLVLFIKPGNAFLFSNAKGDCSGRSVFMYNALYTDSSQIDAALFGSSKTMNGVNDSLMNSFNNAHFLNLGYCRFGRNLDYFFINEFCKKHHPKKIILEVRETEGDNTHALSPFFLSVSSISEGVVSGRTEVFEDLYNKWLCNLKYLRTKLFHKEIKMDTLKIKHGFWYGNKETDIQALIIKKNKDSIERITNQPTYSKMNSNSNYYFIKLKKLCSEKRIELYFLYLPSYGNLSKQPAQKKDYETFGKVLIPPDSIVCKSTNFSDYNHLNKQGADILSLWLKNALNKSTFQ